MDPEGINERPAAIDALRGHGTFGIEGIFGWRARTGHDRRMARARLDRPTCMHARHAATPCPRCAATGQRMVLR